MEEASYYFEQAMRARRLATGMTRRDIREKLLRLAEEYDEVAKDIAQGARVRHPELLRRGAQI
ncbi:MAG TPA: hypothetical protein VGR91_02605 [Stellaceae bacterium]|nr:hypothetical protein [Stellaceae bacterium]